MIIVTGGAGFIGSNIVKALNDRGIEDIIIVDNLENTSKHLNLNKLKFLDFIDKEYFYSEYFFEDNKVKFVFHNGACSNTTETDGKYLMYNNYTLSKDIFNACVKNKVPLIYASSASVYGNGDKGFNEDNGAEYPINMYAFSKHIFDNYFLMNRDKAKSLVVGLRYFNVYGEQENHKGKMASVIFHFFNQMKRGESIKLFEGSEQFIRDFIYVKDIVDINMHFFDLKNNIKLNGIYNAGTGKARSFYDIAKIMQSAYPDIKIDFIPFPKELDGKYQKFTEADIRKLRDIGGYKKDFTSLEAGVKSYIANLENSMGYIK